MEVEINAKKGIIVPIVNLNKYMLMYCPRMYYPL